MAYDIRLMKLVTGEMVIGKYDAEKDCLNEVASLQSTPTQQVPRRGAERRSRRSAVQLALAFVKTLGEPEKYADLLQELDERVKRVEKRRAEEKAHRRNVRHGKS